MREQYSQLRIIAFALLLLSYFVGCAVERGKIYVVDGIRYCVASGIWRGKWWQHYERGRSCMEGQFWSEAITSFKAARATIRGHKDRWRVNTFGVHFIDDYFPNREIGIAYYYLGQYSEAQRELERSISMTETAKTKYYLNEVRRILIRNAQSDTAPPQIVLDAPLNNLLTNALTIDVKGHAEDDTYVESLVVNGKELFVELAKSRLPFAQEIKLHDGPNTIDITATDLAGRRTIQSVTVYLDRRGPNLSLGGVERHGEPSRRVRVWGGISDETSIQYFELAGKRILMPSGGAGSFDEEIAIIPNATSLPFKVEDAAGNITQGEITLAQPANHQPGIRKGERFQPNLHRWATLQFPDVITDLTPAYTAQPQLESKQHRHDQAPPIIELINSDLDVNVGNCHTQGQLIVYDNSVLLEIKVTDDLEVTKFAIDGQLHQHTPGIEVFFTEIFPLRLSTRNGFLLEATDNSGNITRCEVIVKHKIRKIQQIRFKLKIIQLPFIINSVNRPTEISLLTENILFKHIMKRERFNVSKENSSTTDKKDYKVDSELTGEIVESNIPTGKSLFVIVDIKERGDKEPNISDGSWVREDIYGTDVTKSKLENLMNGLAIKLIQHFPIVEGEIARREGQDIVTSLTSMHKIKPRMKLNIFCGDRESHEKKCAVSQQEIQDEPSFLGEAQITEVSDKYSEAELLRIGTPKEVWPKDKVITK